MSHRERGQVLPFVALAVVTLIGAAALAVDIGYLRFEQRAQQIATDAGAIGGANELIYTAATVTSGAKTDTALNGYTDGSGNVTVTVNNPPLSGAYAGDDSAVEVIITKTGLPSFLAGVMLPGTRTVQTRAVAALNPNALGCVYALNGDLGTIRLNGGGGGGITAPSCGVLANGSMTITGNANVDARFVGYYGTGPKGGTFPEGQPTKLSARVLDPCLQYTSCAYLQNLKPSTMACVDSTPQNSSALPPGRYCNAVTGDVTFAPQAGNALYVFDKPIPTGNMTGNGVTIYNNSGTGITWNGNVNVVVKAPTGGSTSGMVYFQPASNTGSVIKNGQQGTVDFEGGFYAPTAAVTLNGNLPNVALFVAGSILMNGGGMTVGGSTSLQTVGHAVLVE